MRATNRGSLLSLFSAMIASFGGVHVLPKVERSTKQHQKRHAPGAYRLSEKEYAFTPSGYRRLRGKRDRSAISARQFRIQQKDARRGMTVKQLRKQQFETGL